MIRQLLWKEWSEQSWRFYWSVLMVAGFTMIGVTSPILTDGTVIGFLIYLITIPLPWLIAMGVLVPDRTKGVQPFLISLPIRAQTLFWIKSLLGLGNCLLPLVAAGVIFLVLAGTRELSLPKIFFLFFMMAVNVFQNFAWTLTLSFRARKEAHVGFIGILLLFSLLLYIYITLILFSSYDWLYGTWLFFHPLFPYVLLFYNSGSEDMYFESVIYQNHFMVSVTAVILQIVLSLCLLYWGSQRYAQEDLRKS